MDLGMPNKDGFEASEEILRIQQDGNCSILALTSFHDQVSKDKCIKIGMKEVLNKPLRLVDLIRIILIYHFKLTYEQYFIYTEIENLKIENSKK